MRCPGILLAVALVPSCVTSSLVLCGDLACPVGDVCVLDHCASPEAVVACDGKAGADECSVGGLPGECRGGACTLSGCGNALIDGDEVCDDGNIDSGDGCRADCLKVELCGDGVSTSYGDGGLAINASFRNVSGMAVDATGNLYIADYSAQMVRRIDATTQMVTTVAGQIDPAGTGPLSLAILADPRAFVLAPSFTCLPADALAWSSSRGRRRSRLPQVATRNRSPPACAHVIATRTSAWLAASPTTRQPGSCT